MPTAPSSSRLARLRKRAGGLLSEHFFRGVSRLGRLDPLSNPNRHGIRVHRDVPYLGTGLKAHTLDIYQPIGPSPHPVVVYIHGGGFRILSKDTHWWAGLLFASRTRSVVFNLNYRLAPQHPFPAAPRDCAEALGWVLDNAHRFGGDIERLAIAGESAGANLSLVMTLATCMERPEPWCRPLFERAAVPRALFPACGFLQVSDGARFKRLNPTMSTFIHDRIESICNGYLPPDLQQHPNAQTELADPLLILESDLPMARPLPPMYLNCGLRDPVLNDTQRLESALQRRGITHHVHYDPQGFHGSHAVLWLSSSKTIWREAFAFFEEHVNPTTPQR
ncbi:MAG: alpha/beta hydrolase fold domain-containing protein [Myxococcota bacterium]